MLQSNRANIGMFEALQADQHAKTGLSQMAVFNDLNAVKAASDKYVSVMKALEAYVKSLSDRRAELDKLESQVDDREVAVEKGPEAKAFLSLVDKEVARIHEIKDDAVKQKEINALLAIAHQQDNVTYQLKKVRVWIDDGRNGASSYVKKQLK